MKIIYMGTPEFAVPPLQALAREGYEIQCVITRPDKARDRGKKVQPTPVKVAAESLGIPVYQPETVKGNQEFFNLLKGYGPDAIVVAAYGRLLPTEILELPPLGCINIHGSLLPKLRGAAPIQRAILNGETETGISLMKMAEGMDSGDVFSTVKTPIGLKRTDQLFFQLSYLGAKLLIESLPLIENGELKAVPQDHSLATHAPMITKEEGLIDFAKTPEEIERQIRAMDPFPGAYTLYMGERLKVWDAEVVELSRALGQGADEGEALDLNQKAPVGTVLQVSPSGLLVKCGKEALNILEIQVAGKKRNKVSEFIKGNSIELGSVLGV